MKCRCYDCLFFNIGKIRLLASQAIQVFRKILVFSKQIIPFNVQFPNQHSLHSRESWKVIPSGMETRSILGDPQIFTVPTPASTFLNSFPRQVWDPILPWLSESNPSFCAAGLPSRGLNCIQRGCGSNQTVRHL